MSALRRLLRVVSMRKTPRITVLQTQTRSGTVRHIRFALAWLLYGLGCGAYWFIDHDHDVPWHWWHHAAFHVYNWSMIQSNMVQGEGSYGLWSPVKPGADDAT
jgi:hypothetical protein